MDLADGQADLSLFALWMANDLYWMQYGSIHVSIPDKPGIKVLALKNSHSANKLVSLHF